MKPPPSPGQQYPQFQQSQQQQMKPPQQPYAALCNREILGPYHAVELYQDGALWIIDIMEMLSSGY